MLEIIMSLSILILLYFIGLLIYINSESKRNDSNNIRDLSIEESAREQQRDINRQREEQRARDSTFEYSPTHYPFVESYRITFLDFSEPYKNPEIFDSNKYTNKLIKRSYPDE